VIDLHCHVLPGIDDGPGSAEESLALALAAGTAGVDTLVATSHVSWRYRNDAATIGSLTADVNAQLSGSPPEGGAGVRVLPGAEVAASVVMDLDPEELQRLGLGGGRWLLLEPPLASSAAGLEIVVAELERRGHGIVLAHPERCPAFHRDTRLLESLIEGGALTSITAGSLTGRFGATVRKFAYALLKAGAVHNVASDFHDLSGRPPGMSAALESAGLSALSDWLTCEVPLAILEDRELPHKPPIAVPVPTPSRRGLWARARSLRRAL
jgi:protein-tyrosine phosphatase